MGGDESNDKSGDAEEHGVEAPSESTTTEEDVGRVSSDSHHVSEPPQSSEYRRLYVPSTHHSISMSL